MTFEQGFADTERAAIAAGKAIGQLAGAAKQLQRAATEGDIHRVRKSSERIADLIESARQEVENARSAWPFTLESEETYLRESYAADLIRAGKAENLDIQQRDEGLVVFPSIVRILPSERAIRINKKKVQAVRPTQVVKLLKAIHSRKAKAAPEAFLEVLYRAYSLLVGAENGKTIALVSLYDTLTILPGSSATYDRTDFLRDLFLLDRSGHTKTKAGNVCSLPASTGTRNAKGTFAFTAPDGQTITYYGIRFTKESE